MTGYQQMQVVTYLHSRFHKGVSGGPLAKPTAVELGPVDREWLQKTVRGMVEWVPDADLTLVAALGRIARASP